MSSSKSACLLLALVVASALSCDSKKVTAPPKPGLLSGDWSGTFSVGDSSQSIRVLVRHGDLADPGDVHMYLATDEEGYEFTGSLEGSILTGTIWWSDFALCEPIGEASDTSITLSAPDFDSTGTPLSIHLTR